MSRNSIRRAALGLLFAVLLGIAMPVPASAWFKTGAGNAGFFSVVWEWLQDLWPAEPASAPPACTGNCTDTGYGVDPNG